MIFAHGFGCDQNMWRWIAPAFEPDYRVVLFDLVGSGGSDLTAYDTAKYNSLAGYSEDLIEICDELEVKDGVFVGHSVSAMIGALTAIRRPELFRELVLIGPSPCYVNDGDYQGGFTPEQIEELLTFLDDNHLGWSATMGPVIMGAPDKPELSEELVNSFCRTDPEIAKHFARVTFTSDNRTDLPDVPTRSLVIQCEEDVIAQPVVGDYVQKHMPNAELALIAATGHCPHMSAPELVIPAMKEFLNGDP